MPKPTRAEVLAEYLGLNEKTHPECYWLWDDLDCFVCKNCASPMDKEYARPTLAMPDPFAQGSGAWLDALTTHGRFRSLHKKEPRQYGWYRAYVKDSQGNLVCFDGDKQTPVEAIVRAMMAADSTFAAKMKGAE